MTKTHPFDESHNYRVVVERDDGYSFEVIAAVVDFESETTGSIHGIQPSHYRGEFPTGLFWASGTLGGPHGKERRGLYPSVTIGEDDPLAIVSVEKTDEPLKSEQ